MAKGSLWRDGRQAGEASRAFTFQRVCLPGLLSGSKQGQQPRPLGARPPVAAG